MSERLRAVALLAALCLLVAACDSDDGTPRPTATPTRPAPASRTPTPTATPTLSIVEELAATGIGQYLDTIAPASMAVVGGWERYYYEARPDNAICLQGGAYQVAIRRGTENKVLLYLEGGGACSSHQTCWAEPIAKLTADPFFGFGLLDATNPANPIAGWSVVYVPYCDGSVHGGNNTVVYEGRTTYHHGLANLSAAVSLMRDEFPDPEVILISGSSAGGYGTFTGYGVARVAYPATDLLVLDDSGPGIQNPAQDDVARQRAENWRFQDVIPASCTECMPQVTYLAAWALDRDPTLRLALFNYLQDGILRFFLDFTAEGFETLLRDVTDDLHDRYPTRFKRFFKQGDSHVILPYPQFYTMEVDGTVIRDWTADFLTDGPAWRDLVEAPAP